MLCVSVPGKIPRAVLLCLVAHNDQMSYGKTPEELRNALRILTANVDANFADDVDCERIYRFARPGAGMNPARSRWRSSPARVFLWRSKRRTRRPKIPGRSRRPKPRRPSIPRVRESLARSGAFVKTFDEFSI